MINNPGETERYLAVLRGAKERIVGIREVTKALKAGKAKTVFIAADTESKLVEEIIAICQQAQVSVVEVASRDELGQACQIEVGAAVAALNK